MYLCFIDESGTPPKPTASNPRPYFVMAGVIIHEDQWDRIASELERLKAHPSFLVRGEIKWRFFGPENRDANNPFSHLSQEARDDFRSRMIGILSKRVSVKVIATCTDVKYAYKQAYIDDEDVLYAYTYKATSERFQYFLQDMSRSVGSRQRGVLIADHRGRDQDDRLRTMHRRFLKGDTPFTSNYKNFVETLFLTPSHLSVGIQFADMIAGAVGRKFNTGDETYYRLVEPMFRRSPDGEVEGFGLVRYPQGRKV